MKKNSLFHWIILALAIGLALTFIYFFYKEVKKANGKITSFVDTAKAAFSGMVAAVELTGKALATAPFDFLKGLPSLFLTFLKACLTPSLLISTFPFLLGEWLKSLALGSLSGGAAAPVAPATIPGPGFIAPAGFVTPVGGTPSLTPSNSLATGLIAGFNSVIKN